MYALHDVYGVAKGRLIFEASNAISDEIYHVYVLQVIANNIKSIEYHILRIANHETDVKIVETRAMSPLQES